MLRHATVSLITVLVAAPVFASSGVRASAGGRVSVPQPPTYNRRAPGNAVAPGHPGYGYATPGYAGGGAYYGHPAPSQGFTTTRYQYGSPPRSSYGYAGGYGGYRGRGYWSGGYVPRYGYGYSYYYAPTPAPLVVGGGGYAVAEQGPVVVEEDPGVRVVAGVEGTGFLSAGNVGGTLGISASVEGHRWGFAVSAADIMTPYTDGVNHLADVTAHLSFAFLTGKYGRLRVEGGADGFFAPHTILVGPTAGLSGVIWLGGPVGIEGSVMATPWPYLQFDGKLGLAVGLGQFGLRAGWRVLALSDRGIVDGTEHDQLISGPYVGMSIVF
jgi:hypothetical protein